MLKRLPLIPTLVVLAAVAVMVRLGFWQIDRMHQKEAMLARYAAAGGKPEVLPLGVMPADEGDLFRRAVIHCDRVTGWQQMAGVNAKGESGIAQVATCMTGGPTIAATVGDLRRPGDIVLGWSRDLRKAVWTGGDVVGTLAPGANGQVRLVADPPLTGLEPNARPDPANIPNNHWSYAIQWFLFAGTALVIYGLALRKRLAAKDAEG